MATLEKIKIKFLADTSDLKKAINKVSEATISTTKESLPAKSSEKGKGGTSFSIFEELQNLKTDDVLGEVASKRVFSGQPLSKFDQLALKNLEGIKNILEEDLEKRLQAERERLEEQEVDPGEIEKRLKIAKKAGLELIDDLVEDFTDTLDEAVKDLSQKVADAFVEMALKGEFSIKTLGDIFLRTFLDVIAKELIQDPLEELLGNVVGSIFDSTGGSATGGEIAAGVPTFINEHGQEVFIPHTPGKIVNADQTRQMFSKSQGVVVNQNLSFDTAIKNDMIGTILQASPLLVEQTKIAVIESLQGRRI